MHNHWPDDDQKLSDISLYAPHSIVLYHSMRTITGLMMVCASIRHLAVRSLLNSTLPPYVHSRSLDDGLYE